MKRFKFIHFVGKESYNLQQQTYDALVKLLCKYDAEWEVREKVLFNVEDKLWHIAQSLENSLWN
jgi:hypothetical protein